MNVRVITPPEPIVLLDEAKRHLRVEHDSDEAWPPSEDALAARRSAE